MDDAAENATLQQALSIFREIVELPECERVAWFEARCGQNEELRTTVEQLLAADSRPGGPLDDRAALFAGGAGSTQSSDRFAHTEVVSGPRRDNEARLGQHVGAYRLVRLLGHGGMGAVYLAERNAGGFTQQVALKLIRSGYEGSDARRRFERERQILSRLQHPAIARLYDGGVLEDGSPWFAMELIEGETLSQWCARWAVPVRERAALLLRIAEAVQYAHQQLVIHRDLKPTNILIDKDGAPHVLDFGIAALLDEQAEEATSPHTFIHTPEYAAPEQIRGDPHSAATDVFTLGIILYELLAGMRPFQQANATPFRMQRAVLELEAPALQAALPTDPAVLTGLAAQRSATPPQLRRQLTGDLDLIVHKALEKRPQDRYQSVAAFCEDLRRHLDGRAVQAVPPTIGYRAGKFLRRHRIPVAAGVVIFAVLTVATGISLAQARAARQQAERAEAVKQFIVSLFQKAGPGTLEGEPLSASALLEGGSKRIAAELADQPRIAGDLLNTIGNAYFYLGDYAAARRQLEASLAFLPAEGDTLRPRFDVLAHLVDLASHQSDVANGMRWTEEALVLRDRIRARERGWRRFIFATKALRHYFGYPEQDIDSRAEDLDLSRARLMDQAGGSRKAGIELRRAVAEARLARPGEDERRVRIALNDYALALYADGQNAEAAKRLRQLVQQHERRHGAGHPDILRARHNLSLALRELDQLVEAERIARENIAIAARALPPSHPLNAYIKNALARILRLQQRYREAAEMYAKARAVFADPDADPGMLATLYNNEAKNFLDLGDMQASTASLAAADGIWRESVGEQYPERVDLETTAAHLAMERGDLARAAAELDRLRDVERAKPEPELAALLRIAGLRAAVHVLAGEARAARRILEASWPDAQKSYPAPHIEQIAFLRGRAEAALTDADTLASEALLDTARRQFARRDTGGGFSPALELLRARIAWARQDFATCAEAATRAHAGYTAQLGEQAWPTLAARAWKAAAAMRMSPGSSTARDEHRSAAAAFQTVRPFDPQAVQLGALTHS